jgi:hypothetical protein
VDDTAIAETPPRLLLLEPASAPGTSNTSDSFNDMETRCSSRVAQRVALRHAAHQLAHLALARG